MGCRQVKEKTPKEKPVARPGPRAESTAEAAEVASLGSGTKTSPTPAHHDRGEAEASPQVPPVPSLHEQRAGSSSSSNSNSGSSGSDSAATTTTHHNGNHTHPTSEEHRSSSSLPEGEAPARPPRSALFPHSQDGVVRGEGGDEANAEAKEDDDRGECSLPTSSKVSGDADPRQAAAGEHQEGRRSTGNGSSSGGGGVQEYLSDVSGLSPQSAFASTVPPSRQRGECHDGAGDEKPSRSCLRGRSPSPPPQPQPQPQGGSAREEHIYLSDEASSARSSSPSCAAAIEAEGVGGDCHGQAEIDDNADTDGNNSSAATAGRCSRAQAPVPCSPSHGTSVHGDHTEGNATTTPSTKTTLTPTPEDHQRRRLLPSGSPTNSLERYDAADRREQGKRASSPSGRDSNNAATTTTTFADTMANSMVVIESSPILADTAHLVVEMEAEDDDGSNGRGAGKRYNNNNNNKDSDLHASSPPRSAKATTPSSAARQAQPQWTYLKPPLSARTPRGGSNNNSNSINASCPTEYGNTPTISSPSTLSIDPATTTTSGSSSYHVNSYSKNNNSHQHCDSNSILHQRGSSLGDESRSYANAVNPTAHTPPIKSILKHSSSVNGGSNAVLSPLLNFCLIEPGGSADRNQTRGGEPGSVGSPVRTDFVKRAVPSVNTTPRQPVAVGGVENQTNHHDGSLGEMSPLLSSPSGNESGAATPAQQQQQQHNASPPPVAYISDDPPPDILIVSPSPPPPLQQRQHPPPPQQQKRVRIMVE